jgi:hypothetical protein
MVAFVRSFESSPILRTLPPVRMRVRHCSNGRIRTRGGRFKSPFTDALLRRIIDLSSRMAQEIALPNRSPTMRSSLVFDWRAAYDFMRARPDARFLMVGIFGSCSSLLRKVSKSGRMTDAFLTTANGDRTEVDVVA